jgi:mono/diheme cytochrome c family protein
VPQLTARRGRRLVLLGLLGGCGLLLSGPAQALAAGPGAVRQIFARYCAQCHGLDGRGGPGRAQNMLTIPDFTKPSWQRSRSKVQMMVSILEGKERQMPANRGLISDARAADLVAYIRTFAPAAAPTRARIARTEPPRTTARTETPRTETARTETPPTETPRTEIGSGAFAVEFNKLRKEFHDLQRQAQGLAWAPEGSAPASRPLPQRAAPTEVASDFAGEFNRLRMGLNDLQRRARQLASGPRTGSPVAGSAPPEKVATSTPSEKVVPSTPPEKVATPSSPSERVAAASAPPIVKVPTAERPFTPDDVARGRELFLGRRPLANGGPACIACHAVHGSARREGGRLGPELTKVYERLGGRTALMAHLEACATPTMVPLYREHGLQTEEVLTLTAYLEDTARHGVEDASLLPLNLLLLGLGGAVLGLATVSTLWGSLARRRRLPGGRAAPPLPPVRQDLAPVPQEDPIGLGI